jgi:crotonobetainyl-CoA:carnitine CoA-transferase CaiB-like acyl-CoA transferase
MKLAEDSAISTSAAELVSGDGKGAGGQVMAALPLSRFKVIDLTRARAGPTAVRQLADWGADVIKVEAPEETAEVGSRNSPDFQNLHRNKRSITLNLKHPQGVEILKRLVVDADVLVENYRPDVKYRLGIDYSQLRQINPRLVYASISGFGQDGPYKDRPGLDQIAQGMGGLMSITGLPGQGPVRAGIAVADVTAGVFCAMGILIALLEREQSGQGQWVQTSLLAAQIALLDFQAARWLLNREIPEQAGNNHPTAVPTGVFATADGHINIAASGNDLFRRLCKALDAEHLIENPDYSSGRARLRNRDRLNREIEKITRTQTSEEWIERLNAAGVPCGPIYRIDQVFADPQVQHLRIAREIEHPTMGRQQLLGQAVELNRTPWSLRMPTPEKGSSTESVLRHLGYDSDAIVRLRGMGVI